jgi:hypothetical protein
VVESKRVEIVAKSHCTNNTTRVDQSRSLPEIGYGRLIMWPIAIDAVHGNQAKSIVLTISNTYQKVPMMIAHTIASLFLY